MTRASASSLTASQTWVRRPLSRSSGAFAPPMRVATQPGSSAFDSTFGQRRGDGEREQDVENLLSA